MAGGRYFRAAPPFFPKRVTRPAAAGVRGDVRAETIDLDAWYRRYGPMVHRRCLRLLGDEQQAVDAMQDTFVQILRASGRLHGQAPSSLLYRTATNVCLNRLRTRRRRPESPGDELLLRIAALDDGEAASVARSVLDRLFGQHPASTRTMAVMHLYDGLTLEEVAAESGLSVSGVRKRLRGLQASLRELEGV
jgi:RNA polymerase sigma-70 factor (ECF subfamily)